MLSALLFAAASLAGLVNGEKATVEDFVKIRCSMDGNDTFYTWQGSIYSYVPQQREIHLLDFIGYNVGRCEKIDGDWVLITRELSYYLDPKTKERISFWENPFTHETVNVAHVANDPVNNGMGASDYTIVTPTMGAIDSDVPLFYPNPLHGNSSYDEYGGSYPYYEAGEFFKFYFSVDSLKSSTNAVEDVAISWTRVSQWLPWMKMGDIEGAVFYSCSGGRANDLSKMPQWLQDDVKTRLPLYLHSPATYDPEEPNDTSQTVFMEHFDEYLSGVEFPLPAPDEL
jgi:hypothetical protein